LWEKAGGYVSSDFWIMPDFELWFRFWQQAELYTLDLSLAAFRKHQGQIKSLFTAYRTARSVLKKYHRSSLAMFCNDIRYFLSCIPATRRLVASRAMTIIYDSGSNKWVIKNEIV